MRRLGKYTRGSRTNPTWLKGAVAVFDKPRCLGEIGIHLTRTPVRGWHGPSFDDPIPVFSRLEYLHLQCSPTYA